MRLFVQVDFPVMFALDGGDLIKWQSLDEDEQREFLLDLAADFLETSSVKGKIVYQSLEDETKAE